MPPEHYEQAVARAVRADRRAGELEKIVLAREVQVHAPRRLRPGGGVRGAARGVPLLLRLLRRPRRRDAGRRQPRAAAAPRGPARRARSRSPARPGAAPTRRSTITSASSCCATASYREEHAIVARRIERTLRAHAVWVAAAPEPELVRIANIQHLATPIRAQLAAPIEALELAGLMHPTPAVGGEPRSAARADPRARGPRPRLVLGARWAGPTPTGDGEFCVALRCALLRGVGPLLRRQRDRPRLRPGARAGRDRDQAGRRCSRCLRAERPRRLRGSPDCAVEADVARRAWVRTSMIASARPRSERSSAARERLEVCRRARARGRRARRPGSPGRGRARRGGSKSSVRASAARPAARPSRRTAGSRRSHRRRC